MGHLNDVPEDEITSFMVVDFLGELAEVLAGFFLDLRLGKGYVERVEVEEVDETGDEDGLDGLLGFVVLF